MKKMVFRKKTALLLAVVLAFGALLTGCGKDLPLEETGPAGDVSSDAVSSGNASSDAAGDVKDDEVVTSGDTEEDLYPAVDLTIACNSGALTLSFFNNTDKALTSSLYGYVLEKKEGTTWKILEAETVDLYVPLELSAKGMLKQTMTLSNEPEDDATYRLTWTFKDANGTAYTAQNSFKGGVSTSSSRQLFATADSPAFAAGDDGIFTLNLLIADESDTAWMQESLWQNTDLSFVLYYMDLEKMGDKSGVYEVYERISLTPIAVEVVEDVDANDGRLRLDVVSAGWNDQTAGQTYDICLMVYSGDAVLVNLSTKVDISTDASEAIADLVTTPEQ